MICQYCGHKLTDGKCLNPACPGRLRKEEDVYMGRACPPNCPGNISTPAPAEVERLVDRINDELFCGALKGETKSRILAALTNTPPYLSRDVNVPVVELKDAAHRLAMYVLQSEAYQRDMDTRDAVDGVLALVMPKKEGE